MIKRQETTVKQQTGVVLSLCLISLLLYVREAHTNDGKHNDQKNVD